MNLFDTLKTYTDIQKRDSWANTGGAYITDETKTYVRNTLYRVNYPTSVLHNALILALDNFASSTLITWHTASVIDEAEGFISFGNKIVNPYFALILNGTTVAALDPTPVNTNFVPYETPLYSILIPDDELDRILLEVGVPFIQLEELEFTKEQIIDLMIKPAMQEYFKWYPVIKTEIVPMTGVNFDVPIPPGSFGAQRVFVSQGSPTVGANAPGNPLLRYLDEVIYSSSMGLAYNRTRYGLGAKPRGTLMNTFSVMSNDRAVRQGITNYAQRLYVKTEKYPDGSKHIRGYSLKTGLLIIEWAYESNDWNDIEFRQLNEVRNLAAAKVLRALGSLRSQSRSDLPGHIDYDGFLSRADDIEEAVITKWQDHTKAVVIRS